MELGVVILGVLIALAADSWWQNREEVARELAYLRAIQVDMTQTLDSLQVIMQINSESLSRANRLVAALSDPSEADSIPAPFDFTNVYPPSLASGTIDAVIMSGSVSLIRSAEVRAQIVRTSAALDEARAYSRDLAAIGFETIGELAQSAWPALSAVDGAGDRIPPTYGSLRDIPDASPLLFEFANVIGNLQYWSRSAQRAAEHLLAVVEQELDVRGVESRPDVP